MPCGKRSAVVWGVFRWSSLPSVFKAEVITLNWSHRPDNDVLITAGGNILLRNKIQYKELKGWCNIFFSLTIKPYILDSNGVW